MNLKFHHPILNDKELDKREERRRLFSSAPEGEQKDD